MTALLAANSVRPAGFARAFGLGDMAERHEANASDKIACDRNAHDFEELSEADVGVEENSVSRK